MHTSTPHHHGPPPAQDGASGILIQQGKRLDLDMQRIFRGLPGLFLVLKPDAAQAIRTGFPERRAMLMALTGWGHDDDRQRAREAGFDHHLVKPAEIGALMRLLAGADSDSSATLPAWPANEGVR